MVVEDCVIVSKENVSKGIFSIWVSCKGLAKQARSGQFVDVKCDSFTLRRPISICEIDAENDQIRLVFEIRGQGTEWLAGKNAGECIDLLGPLGNGFPVDNTDAPAVFVGGGIGVPPLLSAAKQYGENAAAILGFRSANAVILEKDFKKSGAAVTVCTDDGTYGFHGVVTVPLEERLSKKDYAVVYACGPKPMLKAVADLCSKNGIKCYVSMEERMACGVGACLSCACKVNNGGGEHYKHVCKDGPVFDASTIVW